MTEEIEEPQLDGMPDASLIVRISGDQAFEGGLGLLSVQDLEANDEVTLAGVKGVVKKVGVEAYKKLGIRPFVQIHVTGFGNVKAK